MNNLFFIILSIIMKFMGNFTAMDMDKKSLTIFIAFLLGSFVVWGCIWFALHGDTHGRDFRNMPQMMENQRWPMMRSHMNNMKDADMNATQWNHPQILSGNQDMTGTNIRQ